MFETVNRNEISTLQSDLDAIETWTKNNNMKLNGIKRKEMIISFLRNETAISRLRIDDLSLELVKMAR
jgi:predicted  nucleic acid-binding Zn-ribbon protein